MQGFVRRAQSAQSEMEHLGVNYTQQPKFDTLLKNFLCDTKADLVESIRNQHKDWKMPFDDACDHLLDHHDISKWSDDQQRLLNPAKSTSGPTCR
jgi:hypothetical protein